MKKYRSVCHRYTTLYIWTRTAVRTWASCLHHCMEDEIH